MMTQPARKDRQEMLVRPLVQGGGGRARDGGTAKVTSGLSFETRSPPTTILLLRSGANRHAQLKFQSEISLGRSLLIT